MFKHDLVTFSDFPGLKLLIDTNTGRLMSGQVGHFGGDDLDEVGRTRQVSVRSSRRRHFSTID